LLLFLFPRGVGCRVLSKARQKKYIREQAGVFMFGMEFARVGLMDQSMQGDSL